MLTHTTHMTSFHTLPTDALYPTLVDLELDHLVEDTASPHNNDVIRQSHTDHGVNIVG